jgi:hypothetical protein
LRLVGAEPGGPHLHGDSCPRLTVGSSCTGLTSPTSTTPAPADYGGSWNGPSCQPARDVDVPADTQQRWPAAANDPNVTCAIATPIVRSPPLDTDGDLRNTTVALMGWHR